LPVKAIQPPAYGLCAAAEQWLHAGGMHSEQTPFWARYMQRYLDPARDALGPNAVAELEEAGRAMGFEAAIDEVLEGRPV
jgi:hypothetical protein